MTIEVIKRGVPPSEKTYKATCGNCNSILTFKNSDFQIPRDQRDSKFIKCLVCNGYIFEHSCQEV